MFTYVTSLLYRLESRSVRIVLLGALGALILAVLLVSFVRWLRRRRQDNPESWTALLTDAVGSILKLLAGLAVVAGLALHLRFESEEFARLRGGVTQQAYEAVKTIWGQPHVQRELGVALLYKTTHFYDKDGLEMDADKLKATTQPIGYRKAEEETIIPGNAVLEADHDIQVAMNYRRKGSAEYPGFEVACSLKYRAVNFADRDVTARFTFPLPHKQGVVADFSVVADGKALDRGVVFNGEQATWDMPLKPGQEVNLAISYRSRGLDYLRLEPGAGRKLLKYRIRLACKDVPKDRINYPIGCMTPTDVREADGGSVLTWNLDNAVTRLGMGVILPKRQQEGYHVSQILAAAPWGLVLMLAMVLVTFLILGRKAHWIPLLLLAVAYDLYYLFMAYLADCWPGLPGGMIISGLVLTVLVTPLFFAWTEKRPAAATVKFFILFIAVYPLIRISEHEGLFLSMLYVGLLAYTVILLVLRRRATAGE